MYTTYHRCHTVGLSDEHPADELRAQLANLKAVLAGRKALLAECQGTAGWGTAAAPPQ